MQELHIGTATSSSLAYELHNIYANKCPVYRGR